MRAYDLLLLLPLGLVVVNFWWSYRYWRDFGVYPASFALIDGALLGIVVFIFIVLGTRS